MAWLRAAQTSVRSRILWTFAAIVAMVVAVRTFSHWVDDQRRDRVEALRVEYQGLVGEFFAILRRVDEAAKLLSANIRGESPEDPAAIEALRAGVVESLLHLRREADTPGVQRLLDQLGAEYERVRRATDQLLAVLDPASPEALASHREELEALTDLWRAGSAFMDSMLSLAEQGTEVFASDIGLVQAASGHLQTLNTLLHLAVILVSTALVFRLGRSITRPIIALEAGVQKFSRGHVAPAIDVHTGDEFDRLARCFEGMSAEIQRMLAEGKKISELSLMVIATLDMDEIARRLIAVIRQFTGGRLIALTLESVTADGYVRYTSREAGHCEKERVQDLHSAEVAAATRTAHSVISIPLIAQQKVIGSLEIRDHAPDLDIEKQTHLVSSILVGVSMALRNAQLFATIVEEKERADAQAAELARLNSELEEIQRFKSQFLAGMSHRLRTPLNSVIGCANLLLDGVLGELSARQREAVETVRRGGLTLMASIDHILNYARLEAGDLDMLWGEFDVAAMIGEAVSRVRATLGMDAGNPAVTIAPGAERWCSDRVKCRCIVQYLVENAAIRAPGRAVRVCAAVEGDDTSRRLAIAVLDEGPQIPPDQIAHVFDLYRGLNVETGHGLGLTIAHRLAMLLDGEITIDSPPGSGSTFTLRVPDHGRS